MPRPLPTTLLLFLVLPLAACAVDPDVEIHPVNSTAIAALYSFEVLPDNTDSPLGPMRSRSSRVQIERALADRMTRLGYREVEDNADIQLEFVTYVTEEYQDHHQERYSVGKVVIDRHLPEPSEIPLRIGTLHVHLLHDGRALYEGIATDVVEGPVSEERIRRAVELLLAEVPAGPMMQPDKP